LEFDYLTLLAYLDELASDHAGIPVVRLLPTVGLAAFQAGPKIKWLVDR
tara:strand:- start:360 stop:506 length:147 start_codon:yes stop_codon:yes gene_type:complete